jgi:hypothetical protein
MSLERRHAYRPQARQVKITADEVTRPRVPLLRRELPFDRCYARPREVGSAGLKKAGRERGRGSKGR